MNCPVLASCGRLILTLLDLPVRAVIGQFPRAMKDRQGSVRVAVDTDFDLDVVTAVRILWDLKGEAFKRHAVISAHGSFVLLTEDVIDLSVEQRDKP